MIDRMGLRGHENKRPSGLSGVQQQRVAIGRALVFEPSVLLLDEPFSALDKNLRASMQDEVRRLHQDTGTTFVFVTHDQSEALALSTRVAIFNHGEIRQVGSPKDVYERPADRFVAEFLGDVNILAMDGLTEVGSQKLGNFEGYSVKFDLADATKSSNFAIRPEYMSLSASASETQNSVLATVQNITYLGGESRIALKSDKGTPINIRMPTREMRAEFETGRPVWATWSPDQGFFL
jgi:putative spermidine/putrescine transport system ATP-binding protein